LIDQRSAGPSFRDIALKYEKEEGAVDKLGAKVIKGGAGVWGETAMSAHPQISVEDARSMVQYILTLSKEKASKSMPLVGTATPGKEEDGAYLLTTSYYDKGANSLPSISATETIVLRNPTLAADQANELRGPRVVRQGRTAGLENVRNNGWAAFKNIDLTGVKGVEITGFINDQTVGGEAELHLDKPDGKLLGKVKLTTAGRSSAKTKLAPADGMHDLYVVFKNEQAGDKNLFYFGSAKLLNK
jgi:cytochrome c